MKNAKRMKRQEVLLQRIRKQRKNPSIKLWEQYLELEETPLKESIGSPGRFAGTTHDGGIFERSPSLTSEETTIAINRILSDMPDIQQKILRLTFWDGMTENEIAAFLKVSRSTVRYQKHAEDKNCTSLKVVEDSGSAPKLSSPHRHQYRGEIN